MKKLLFVLALFSGPVYAQEPVKETPQEINYYARDFPQWAEQDKGSAVERAYNRFIVASDNHAKALAACKSCKETPVVKVEGTIVVQVRVDDGRYRPRCPYNNCR